MRFSFIQKLGAAVLIALWLIWGTNLIGDALVPVGTAPAAPAKTAAATPASGTAVPAKATAATPAAGSGLAARLAAADVKAGAKAFKKCKACHTTGRGGKHRIGPNLWDVVGRAKGGAAGFRYSPALAGMGGAWDYAGLDGFLAKPKDYVPGTKMMFPGMKKAARRAAVIVYLRTLSDSPKPLP